MALAQWGSQFLLPIRPGEQLDPDRLRFGLGVYARRSAASEQCIEFRVRRGDQVVTLHARGGPDGTTLSDGAAADATLVIEGDALDLVGVALGAPHGRARAPAVARARSQGAAGRGAHSRYRGRAFRVRLGGRSGRPSASFNPQPQRRIR